MKLTPEESHFLNSIAVVAGKDKSVVKSVFKAALKAFAIEIIVHNEELVIPFLCKLKYEHVDKMIDGEMKTVVSLKATPSKALIDEITNIIEGEKSPTMFLSEKSIQKTIQKFLDIATESLNEDIHI